MIILETDRLTLRRLISEDLDPLFALYRDPEVRRYFPEGTLTYAETQEELEWFLNGHPEHPELGLWATLLKSANRFIGRCGLLPWTIDGRPEVEVAYLLAKDVWGQGLGTEAAQGVLNYGFEKLNRSRLICLVEHGNQASIRVTQKIGMAFEKEGQDDKGPFLLYAKYHPALERFFEGQPESFRLFEALLRQIDLTGPSGFKVSKSQIAFRRKKPFAWLWMPGQYLRRNAAPLVLTLGFPERDPSPRWKQIVEPAQGRFTHHLELFTIYDMDEQVAGWLRSAWELAG